MSPSISCTQSVPISLFTEIIVLSELVTACLLAVTPTSLSPSFEKATTLGVVLEPSEFGITTAFPPSIVATQLFVVPRSIPITADPISISPDFFLKLLQFECHVQYAVVNFPLEISRGGLWKYEVPEWSDLILP